MPRNARWPDHRPFVLALSHDVDRVRKRLQFLYYLIQAAARRQPEQVRRHLQSLRANLRGDDAYWNFERIQRLEDELGVRSTFFFLHEQGIPRLSNPQSWVLFSGRYSLEESRIQQVIRRLDAGGWEIGLHGSYESYRSEPLLRAEKERLEAVVGKPVHGIRQHYLNLEIPETWQIQARVGLLYDSTLGFKDRIGFRWDMCLPFFPRTPLDCSPIRILQIPMGLMDAALLRMESPWQAVLSLIEEVEEEQGVLTINWHQRVFNPWEHQAYVDMYIDIIAECTKRGAWMVPLRCVANWWQSEQEQDTV